MVRPCDVVKRFSVTIEPWRLHSTLPDRRVGRAPARMDAVAAERHVCRAVASEEDAGSNGRHGVCMSFHARPSGQGLDGVMELVEFALEVRCGSFSGKRR